MNLSGAHKHIHTSMLSLFVYYNLYGSCHLINYTNHTLGEMCKPAESKQNKQEVSCTVILPLKLVFSGPMLRDEQLGTKFRMKQKIELQIFSRFDFGGSRTTTRKRFLSNVSDFFRSTSPS